MRNGTQAAGEHRNGEVFRHEDIVVWKCRNCGYIHVGKGSAGALPHLQASEGVFRTAGGGVLIFLFFYSSLFSSFSVSV